MSEETKEEVIVQEEQEVQEEEESQSVISDEIVEVEWHEVEPALSLRQRLLNLDDQLSSMLLNFEKQKATLVAQSIQLEEHLQVLGRQLRDSKQIDPSLIYELKLPQTAGEKAYFVRKGS